MTEPRSDIKTVGIRPLEPSCAFLAGGGEMGALMRTHDWSGSPIGPPEQWPDALKMAVSICLNSRFPMLLGWGPEFVMLYNDAYRPILGTTKHPASLGSRGRDIMPEIWTIIGPQLASIWRGEATWSHDLLLPLNRNNYIEEAYFTYSYSPIKHADGRIGGVFTAVTETTDRVLSERRLRILRELASCTAEVRGVESACQDAIHVLGAYNPDIPFALLYLLDEAGDRLRAIDSTGLPYDAYAAEVALQGDDPWSVSRVVRTGEPVLLHDLSASFGVLPGGTAPEPTSRALVLPVARLGTAASTGALVLGINPRRALDDDYRGFFELVAGHFATAISNARAYSKSIDALRLSEARFRDFADSAPVMIWVSDANAVCSWFNRAWLAFTGRTLEQELGQGWTDNVHPEDWERWQKTYRSAFEQREPFRMGCRLRRHDGEWRHLDNTGVPHYAEDGAFIGYIGSCTDVTDVRRWEAALRRSREEALRLNETLEQRVEERTKDLAAANRQLLAEIEEREKVASELRQMQRLDAIGQLTSGVAHDFNNLLTVILGNVSYLEKTWAQSDDAKLLRRLSHTRQAAERGAKLIAQLLAFSRRQRLEPRTVNLNDTVGKMRDLLQSTMGGSFEIETILTPGVWPALVDPTQIELVVLNLAINARDAMQLGGRLTVATANASLGEPLRSEEPQKPGDYVMLTVSDTGSGMTEEVLAKAFEPFFTTKRVGKGSGLGLSQVLGFAKQSEGGVQIETKLGEGTTVRVYFPRSTPSSDDRRPLSAEALAALPRSAVVLIVDDDEHVRHVTATMLEAIGHTAIEAGSGGAALEILAGKQKIDVALIDFAMPGMSGVDLAREARLRLPALPIVFITGYADSTVLASIRHEHILRKPFLEHDLDLKIRAALLHKHVGTLDELMSLG